MVPIWKKTNIRMQICNDNLEEDKGKVLAKNFSLVAFQRRSLITHLHRCVDLSLQHQLTRI